jgi:hypothetical protein
VPNDVQGESEKTGWERPSPEMVCRQTTIDDSVQVECWHVDVTMVCSQGDDVQGFQ